MIRYLLIFSTLISFHSLFAASEPMTVSITGAQAYDLYHHLNVEEIYEGKVKKKLGKNLICTYTAFYPGDFEYECQLKVDRDGTTSR